MSAAPALIRPTAEDAGERLTRACTELWRRAAQFDRDGADPVALCAPLTEFAIFVDVLPLGYGGSGAFLEAAPLAQALMMVGGADLSAGRIFEGHVNAVKLVFRYGDDAQKRALASDVLDGAVCGVWNAETPPGLSLGVTVDGGSPQLDGYKIYASGLGLVSRPLVTAKNPQGAVLLLAPRLSVAAPYDLSGWTVQGMRATATGTVDFTGVQIEPREVIGRAGDYYRSPLFKGGAWRFAAVQTGAVLRIVQLMREELCGRGRQGDPHQKARLGAAAIASETAQLWVTRAASLAEGEGDASIEPAAIDAYVNLTRLAVERSALEVIGLAQRGLGLSALTRPNPVERVIRDLSTYLRQPFPDGALEDAAAYVGQAPNAPPWSAARAFAS